MCVRQLSVEASLYRLDSSTSRAVIRTGYVAGDRNPSTTGHCGNESCVKLKSLILAKKASDIAEQPLSMQEHGLYDIHAE